MIVEGHIFVQSLFILFLINLFYLFNQIAILKRGLLSHVTGLLLLLNRRVTNEGRLGILWGTELSHALGLSSSNEQMLIQVSEVRHIGE